jgi:glutamyl-tRNA reductase
VSQLLALGVSHKTAPLELRERLALPEGRAAGVVRELTDSSAIREAAAISTCNRTELYAYAIDPVGAESLALGVLAREAGIGPTELVPHLYTLHGPEATSQLLRVTAGLDSMILGEAEVQGQVKRAYELALVEGTTGPILNRLFRGALAAGKRARTETKISEGAMSVPSVAVELAQRTLGDLAKRRVLVVGAGETAELTARALAARGVEAVFIANRRYDRAIGLADRFGGSAVRFEDLPEQLEVADIVVASTSSPHHVIEPDALSDVMAGRGGAPLLLIDLAVPRDIHPGCRDLDGVRLYDMDDLQELVERNASGRQAEARRAESVLRGEAARFEAWLATHDVAPTIAALRERANEIVAGVVAENESRWEGMTEADRARIEKLAQAVAGRLLHEPTTRLKRAAAGDGGDAHIQVDVLRELFGLDRETAVSQETDAEVHELRPARADERSR